MAWEEEVRCGKPCGLLRLLQGSSINSGGPSVYAMANAVMKMAEKCEGSSESPCELCTVVVRVCNSLPADQLTSPEQGAPQRILPMTPIPIIPQALNSCRRQEMRAHNAVKWYGSSTQSHNVD